MKISILSFWHTQSNYGAILQCFALQRYYSKKGYEVEHIKYCFEDTNTPVRKIKKAINKYLLFWTYRNRMARVFDSFRNKHLVLTKEYRFYDDLVSDAPNSDMYIVGSDQVWNFSNYDLNERNRKILHASFLDFGSSNVVRESYAASWGGYVPNGEMIDEISPLLRKFNRVTVREKEGVRSCKICGFENASVSQDPTLLLNANEYRDLYAGQKNLRKHKRKYIFLYYLNNQGQFDLEKVFNFATENGLDVIYVAGNNQKDSYNKYVPSVEQWLQLIDDAEYVITNSFHCSIFCLLFKKKFGVVLLNGKNENMNDRIANLFEHYRIKPRYVSDDDFSVLEHSIDW